MTIHLVPDFCPVSNISRSQVKIGCRKLSLSFYNSAGSMILVIPVPIWRIRCLLTMKQKTHVTIISRDNPFSFPLMGVKNKVKLSAHAWGLDENTTVSDRIFRYGHQFPLWPTSLTEFFRRGPCSHRFPTSSFFLLPFSFFKWKLCFLFRNAVILTEVGERQNGTFFFI